MFSTQTLGFDESLGTYWEDVDFSCRARRAGFRLQVQENWRVQHKIRKTCGNDPHYTLLAFIKEIVSV